MGRGSFCPRCGGYDAGRYCRHQGQGRRYARKGRHRTFSDKTGMILHYRHAWVGDGMPAVWMFLCGPSNAMAPIHYIVASMSRACGAIYRMMHGIMRKMGRLSATGEEYAGTCSKGVSLDANGENRTVPGATSSCRAVLAGAPPRRTPRWPPSAAGAPSTPAPTPLQTGQRSGHLCPPATLKV